MAEKKFLVDLNLGGNKAKNFRLEDYVDNTSPTSNFVGRMIYTTNGSSTDRLEVYTASGWKQVAYYDELSSGSVTSVGLSLPSIFSVTNSPVTSTGTLTASLATQSANTVFAGPASGSSSAPTFRSLEDADIPSTIARTSGLPVAGTDYIAFSEKGAALGVAELDGNSLVPQDQINPTFINTLALDFNDPTHGTVTGPVTLDLYQTGGSNIFNITVEDPGMAAINSDNIYLYAQNGSTLSIAGGDITLIPASGHDAYLGSITSGNEIATIGDLSGISATVTGTTNQISVSDTGTNDYVVALTTDVTINNDLTLGNADNKGTLKFVTYGTETGYINSDASNNIDFTMYGSPGNWLNLNASGGHVIIQGAEGQYLGSKTTNNQIAVIGDLSSFLTSGDLSNYVTLNGTQTITGYKTFETHLAINPYNENYAALSLFADTTGGTNIATISAPAENTNLGLIANATGSALSLYANQNVSISSTSGGDVILNASSGGEYLGSASSGNQIATIGDLSSYVTLTGTETLSGKTISDSLKFFDGTGHESTIYATGSDLTIHGYNNLTLNTNNADIILNADGSSYLWNNGSTDNLIATHGWVTGQGYLTSVDNIQFVAALINQGVSYGGYTFHNDGGLDTGMFSNGDGSVIFASNDVEVMTFTSPTSGVTIHQDLTVNGNLNVDGTLNAVNRTEVNIEDNTIVLNTSFTGTPVSDAGIKVERGSYTDATLYWNETANKWYVGTPADDTNAAVATALSLAGHGHTASDISDFNTAIDSHLSGSNSISYSSGTIDTTLATTSYLSKSSGLAVDVSSLETKLVTDNFVKKYAETISGSATSYEITHSLGTRDVTVQVYETASPYGQIETAVEYTTTNKVTVYFNTAPTSGDYRVVVTG